MKVMAQEIIVYIIVALCVAYTVRHFLSFFKKRGNGGPKCNCGCGVCKKCAPPETAEEGEADG